MAPVTASDIYPVVRRFLEGSELQKALKAFDKETSFDESAGVKGKKAKALAELELTEACQLWLEGKSLTASHIYPVVRRFLLESGLQRALKAFDKETSFDEAAEVSKGKKAKALAKLELTEACQLWLDGHLPPAGTGGEGNSEEPQKKDKRKAPAEVAAAAADGEEVAPASAEERPKKRRRKDPEAEKAEQTQGEANEAEEAAEEPKVEKKEKKRKDKAEKQEEAAEAPKAEKKEKKKEAQADEEEEKEEVAKTPKREKKEQTGEEPVAKEEAAEAPKAEKKEKKGKAAERTPGVPFKRIDDDKWKAAIKDSRLMDNTHKAKDRFGGSAGDSWGDRAAEDLLKVKGKGFRKEMAKKKRASWRGGGAIDQGVNSIKFDDSSDEE